MHVWVTPKPHIHREYGQRFPPSFHISYTMDCPAEIQKVVANTWNKHYEAADEGSSDNLGVNWGANASLRLKASML